MSEESAKPLESILNRAVEKKQQQVKGSIEARLKKSWEWNNFDQKGGKGEGASKGKDIPHPGPAPSMMKALFRSMRRFTRMRLGRNMIRNKDFWYPEQGYLAVPKKAGLSKFIHLQSKSQDHWSRCLIRWSSGISFLRGPQPFYRLRVCGWTVSNEEYINVFFQPTPLPVVLRQKNQFWFMGHQFTILKLRWS